MATKQIMEGFMCVAVYPAEVKDGKTYRAKARFTSCHAWDVKRPTVDVQLKDEMVPKLKSAIGQICDITCNVFENEGKNGTWFAYTLDTVVPSKMQRAA